MTKPKPEKQIIRASGGAVVNIKEILDKPKQETGHVKHRDP